MNFAAPPEENNDQKLRGAGRSGWVTPVLIGIVCLGLLVAALEHGRGNFHRLQVAVDSQPPSAPLVTGPGGVDPLRLTRSATAIGGEPEFLSVTMLPGRGMNLFQITAAIPGHGEVPLLASPSLADATKLLSGGPDDAGGNLSTSLGGAFLMPWAGRLSGTSVATPGQLQLSWGGQKITVPAAPDAANLSVQGLLLDRQTTSVKTDVMPNGQSAQAQFSSRGGLPEWPSTFDITISVEMTNHAIDVTMTAKNVGHSPMPIGAGWQPHFLIPSGDRGNASLTLPSNTILEINRRTGLPTGKYLSVQNGPLDFLHQQGKPLGSIAIDHDFVNLQTGVVSDGPVAELRDSAFNYSLRVVPLTSNVTNMRVIAPADKPWVSISPNTNQDDPFGSQWAKMEDSGMTVVPVGGTFIWKVRLEISSLVSSNPF